MERKKVLLIAAAVAAGILVGIFSFHILNIPHPGDSGSDTSTNPGPITVPEPVVSGSINPGQYRNGAVHTWNPPGGGTISVGLKSGGDQDHIYLNINHSKAAADGNSIGYYLKADRGLLEFSGWEEILSDCDSGENASHANFYVPGHLYDQVAVMDYTDAQHYGVRWSDDGSDGTVSGSTITVRAVNLNTAEFVGVFDIKIGYDESSKTYAIQSVTDADVRETRLLSEEERADAIQTAIDFVSETVLPEVSYSVAGWKNVAKVGAVVHKSSRPYFGRMLNTEKKADKFVNHFTCQDTYAVTLPISLYGYITVYLAPQTECIGLTEPTMFDSDDLNLQVYGYDPLNPRDGETIVAPVDFFSY